MFPRESEMVSTNSYWTTFAYFPQTVQAVRQFRTIIYLLSARIRCLVHVFVAVVYIAHLTLCIPSGINGLYRLYLVCVPRCRI